MNKHVRFHTQEKPFKCHYADCGKGFARKGHLTQHIRVSASGVLYVESGRIML